MAILNSEPAAGISPLDVVVDIAHNATSTAFDATFIREKHVTVILRHVTVSWATVNALLANALETNIAIDDSDVSARAVDIVEIERELLLNRGWIENTGA